MNILWLLGILTVVFIICVRLFDTDWIAIPAFILAWLCGITLFLCSIGAIFENFYPDMTREQNQIKTEMLQYQIDHSFYETEYIDERAELYKDVLEWNQEVAEAKYMRKNSRMFKVLYGPAWDDAKPVVLPTKN